MQEGEQKTWRIISSRGTSSLVMQEPLKAQGMIIITELASMEPGD